MNSANSKAEQQPSAVTPYLIVKGAAEAIEFYKKAFGAEEVMRMKTPDGKGILHAEIKIDGASVMLTEECPERGGVAPDAQTEARSSSLYLMLPDVDKVVKKATECGARIVNPVQDMFYGHRTGTVVDPYGHKWTIATLKEALTQDQMKERLEQMMKNAPQQKAS